VIKLFVGSISYKICVGAIGDKIWCRSYCW